MDKNEWTIKEKLYDPVIDEANELVNIVATLIRNTEA